MKLLSLMFSLFSPALAWAELNVVDFLAPVHPGSQRDPSWPQAISIEEIPLNSIDELMRLRVGRWQIVFACDGKPVQSANLARDSYYDGWHSHMEIELNGPHWRGEVIGGEANPQVIKSIVATDKFTRLNSGVILQKFYPAGVVHEVHFGRIRETGEPIFYSEPIKSRFACPKGQFLNISVPLKIRVSSL